MITIVPTGFDAMNPAERLKVCLDVDKKLRALCHRLEIQFTAIMTRESADSQSNGEHLHVLIHVPRDKQSLFDRNVGYWALPAKNHPALNIDVRRAHYGLSYTPGGKRRSAVGYLTKNSPPQARHRDRAIYHRQGGAIFGWRARLTRNIGPKAWNAHQERLRARMVDPLADLRRIASQPMSPPFEATSTQAIQSSRPTAMLASKGENAPPWGLGVEARFSNAIIEQTDPNMRVCNVIDLGAYRIQPQPEAIMMSVPAAKTMAEAGAMKGKEKAPDHDQEHEHEHEHERYGTDPEYLASRIKRDRPDVAARVEAGEFPSMSTVRAYSLAGRPPELSLRNEQKSQPSENP